jgi:hypothetical protein
VSESAFSISPIALFLGILVYVLKRWWDNVDTITLERKRVYSNYFGACYDLVSKALEEGYPKSERPLAKQYDALQQHTPDFLLHASPTVIIISDVFFKKCLPFVFNSVAERGDHQHLEAATELEKSLGVLREAMKSELYSVSPRFQFERWRHRVKSQNLPKGG